jgi:hypothetical protein
MQRAGVGGIGSFANGDVVSHVFSVTPTKIFAYAKGEPFSQTRHRF